jgi:serine/threonine protein phosphatase PrpC
MQNALNQGDDLQTQADRLIDLAKAAGGKDNITVVLIKME